MANPELGEGAAGVVGTWQTVDLQVPDFLEQVRQAVDAFFSALIEVLNILLQILEILKTFAIGFLDPIIALIEALLALIEALLQDLRQAGLYIHGDFYILEGPEFKDLRGGYTAYEKRMISRLVDRRDPNRPDISANSAVVSVFFYLSVDLTALERLLAFLRGLLNLFNQKVNLKPMLGSVTNVQAKYGLDGASIFSFSKPGVLPTRSFLKEDTAPAPVNAVNLTWQMAPSPGNFVTNFAQLPPRGFLVEVSTVREGLALQYDRATKVANEAAPDTKGTDFGPLIDENGFPIRLYGGADQLAVTGLDWNSNTTLLGERKPLASRVFAIKSVADASPIALGDLKSGNDYFLQRTFFVPFGQNLFFPGKGYGVTIPFEDMPRDASWETVNGRTVVTTDVRPTTFFVRVRSVSRAVSSATDWQYELDTTLLTNGNTMPIRGSLALEDVGPPSFPLEINFPGEFSERYLRCVTLALLLVILSRADLPVKVREVRSESGGPPTLETLNFPPIDGQSDPYWASYSGTARLATQLEEAAPLVMPRLLGRDRQIDKFYATTENLVKWRRKAVRAAASLANDYYQQNKPSPTVESIVVQTCSELLDFELFERPLLDLMSEGSETFGIAPNPDSTGAPNLSTVKGQTTSAATLVRGPHFFSATDRSGNRVVGSKDQSPVLYRRTKSTFEELDFVRNLIPDAVYNQAAFALRLAIGPVQRPQEKGWIAIRLFPQGFPDIDRFFDELLSMLRSIREALNAITDLIRQFIEFLQSRILELQALINRINAMIQNLLRLFTGLPSVSGLVTVANGTDGTLQSLVAAQDKPFDSPAAYGGGAVLLAGGIPNVALELFRALVQGDG